jgi:hypothetical protein
MCHSPHKVGVSGTRQESGWLYVNVLGGIDFFIEFLNCSDSVVCFFYFIIPYDMLLDFSVSLKKAKKQIFGP